MVPLLPQWPPEIKATRFLSFRSEFTGVRFHGRWILPRLLFLGTDHAGINVNRGAVPLPLGEGGAKRRVRATSLFESRDPHPALSQRERVIYPFANSFTPC